MKKYRNTSQYIVLEQGKRFLAGQAHELRYAPRSPYLVEENVVQPIESNKTAEEDVDLDSLSAKELRTLVEDAGGKYENKEQAIKFLKG